MVSKKNKEFKSICELRTEFFPKDDVNRIECNNYEELGVRLSEKTLNKIKAEIIKA